MKPLFALLLIIFLAATAWMSRIARDFKLKDNSNFSIMDLELPASAGAVQEKMADFLPGTRQAVLKQLNADYVFMAGCYPGILVLCLIALRRIATINSLQKDLQQKITGGGWKKLLAVLAILQLFAWGLDVWENAQIEQWLNTNMVNNNIAFFKARVYAKFAFALAGFFTAAGLLLLSWGTPAKLTKQKQEYSKK
jgi:hypothetical protein